MGTIHYDHRRRGDIQRLRIGEFEFEFEMCNEHTNIETLAESTYKGSIFGLNPLCCFSTHL